MPRPIRRFADTIVSWAATGEEEVKERVRAFLPGLHEMLDQQRGGNHPHVTGLSAGVDARTAKPAAKPAAGQPASRRRATSAAAVTPSVLEPIFAAIRRRSGKAAQDDAGAFASAFYRRMTEDELPMHDAEGWAALATDLLEFMRRRKPGTALVRLFNPNRKSHGWESPHTVLQVVNDDMPFLVDSVTMALAERATCPAGEDRQYTYDAKMPGLALDNTSARTPLPASQSPPMPGISITRAGSTSCPAFSTTSTSYSSLASCRSYSSVVFAPRHSSVPVGPQTNGPALVLVSNGLRSVRPEALELLRAYDAGPFTQLVKLRLPSAIPSILASAKVCAPLAVLGSILNGWLSTGTGLGNLMATSTITAQYSMLWAAVVVVTVVSVLFAAVVTSLEQVAYARWAPDRLAA